MASQGDFPSPLDSLYDDYAEFCSSHSKKHKAF